MMQMEKAQRQSQDENRKKRKEVTIFQNKSKPMSSFRTEHDADKRTAEARRIRAKYPDRIPVM